jgi:hypothetical protein
MQESRQLTTIHAGWSEVRFKIIDFAAFAISL